ncbi:MAG: dTDP-4-dehydrorhamnose reductase [Bacteroidales bacterium]|nr:dTDP-4-dehydrorhamnose reductase [Bacteroidales bacterium]
MRNILVTGSCGQLGSEIRRLSENNENNYIFTDYLAADGIESLDICHQTAVEQIVKQRNVGTIINCAAYTDVEGAEDNPDACYKINCEGVRCLAKAALETDASLIQISTDFVFDGSKKSPYCEQDSPNPLSIYGKSKLASEQAMMEVGCKGVIIRTSWLYSPYGKNFVKTMLSLGASRKAISVVNDQIGSPTYAADLAEAIIKMLPISGLKQCEIYHFSNEGSCSWNDFASEIMHQAELTCIVNPVSSADYRQKAVRPSYSYMDKTKIATEFNVKLKRWQESLAECLQRM